MAFDKTVQPNRLPDSAGLGDGDRYAQSQRAMAATFLGLLP